MIAEVESFKREVASLKIDLTAAEDANLTLESILMADNSTFESKSKEWKRNLERTIFEKDSLLESTKQANNTLTSELSNKERQYRKEITAKQGFYTSD